MAQEGLAPARPAIEGGRMSGDSDPGRHDHDSDPARTPGAGWVDEGGASHLGPATHIEAGRPHSDEVAEEDDGEED